MPFIWMPYVEEDIVALIPSWVIEQQQLFVSNVSLIHFYMVEWHNGGQVLRQFSCPQLIPSPPVDITEVHGMDKKGSGRDALNCAQKNEPYIFLWNDQHSRRPPLYVLEGGFSSMHKYAIWYMAYGKPFIFQCRYMLIQRDTQPESS
ncbi:serine/threonine-protein phosphatase 7 long form homolog [Gossypium arboreum]|uniref:serine/threonine-protein phosphatase 7 long form homolog n=1 Tax=Gossypium arboreum TaxID=29729 RepID=UPI0008197A06|nr:serine/threonine-protein phosphatase 7 long form homolog [Gossypium arboreum]